MLKLTYWNRLGKREKLANCVIIAAAGKTGTGFRLVAVTPRDLSLDFAWIIFIFEYSRGNQRIELHFFFFLPPSINYFKFSPRLARFAWFQWGPAPRQIPFRLNGKNCQLFLRAISLPFFFPLRFLPIPQNLKGRRQKKMLNPKQKRSLHTLITGKRRCGQLFSLVGETNENEPQPPRN